MQYILTDYNFKREQFAWWENAFNEEELNWLQEQARSADQQAAVGSGDYGVVNSNVRRSNIKWLSNDSNTGWVFSRLAHVVSSLNSQFFHFNLTGFGESLQLTNYDEKNSGMYGWHVDFGEEPTSPSRKLSIVLQLSDPVDYEGGVLELMPDSNQIKKLRKQRGLLVAFPSWTLHQVTPVTSGNRQSLVAWITGPNFK